MVGSKRKAAKTAPVMRWNGTAAARDEQHDAKRTAILEQAARLFDERGYYETSLADIAAALHVTKPTLYYYVKNKEDIVGQIIERAIEDFQPARLVIDPVSSLQTAGPALAAERAIERLASLIKLRGMTAVFTAVADSQLGELEGSTSRVSTIADTWIHLSYAAHGGERNRTLTIIKSRGTSHSNQLRELRLSKDGVTLSDVYMLEGDVLLGTARLEREQRDLRMREEERERTELALAQLEDQRLAAEARARDIEVELRGLSERIATIPDVERVWIAEAGHMLHHDQPERLALEIERFLV